MTFQPCNAHSTSRWPCRLQVRGVVSSVGGGVDVGVPALQRPQHVEVAIMGCDVCGVGSSVGGGVDVGIPACTPSTSRWPSWLRCARRWLQCWGGVMLTFQPCSNVSWPFSTAMCTALCPVLVATWMCDIQPCNGPQRFGWPLGCVVHRRGSFVVGGVDVGIPALQRATRRDGHFRLRCAGCAMLVVAEMSTPASFKSTATGLSGRRPQWESKRRSIINQLLDDRYKVRLARIMTDPKPA